MHDCKSVAQRGAWAGAPSKFATAGVMHYIIYLPRNLSGRMTFARSEVIRPVVKVSPRRGRT